MGVDHLPEGGLPRPCREPVPDLIEGRRLTRPRVTRGDGREFFIREGCRFLAKPVKVEGDRDVRSLLVGAGPETEDVNIVPFPRWAVGAMGNEHGRHEGEGVKIPLEDPAVPPPGVDNLPIPFIR